MLLNFPG